MNETALLMEFEDCYLPGGHYDHKENRGRPFVALYYIKI